VRRALALVAAALLAGCAAVSPGTREPDRYFILDAAPGRQAAARVRVAPTSAAGFYDTQDIVYSRAPGTRAYYQFNHWTERPPRAVHQALAGRFEELNARLVLTTHLEEIYHDAAERPGTARISLTAELSDPASRRLLARRSFRRAAPAASYDAPGAVQGLRQALGELLDDVAAWVEAEAGRGK
jgi:cholesterol transport system auxiliary component